MRILVLNQNNLVPDGQNNRLIYKFPNSTYFKGNSIAVSSVSMYYSWFNITSAYQNNTFSYTWTVAGVTTTYPVVLPDGLYEIPQINAYLQFVMINNGHYLVDGSGRNVYYAELILNPTRYAIQVNTYLVPTSLPATFVQPSNFAGYPTTAQNPVITFSAQFNIIVGYVAGFQTNANVGNAYVPPVSQYVSKTASGTLSYVSTTNPNVQPNSSIYFALSNINNPYSIPSSIIYALVPQGTVGELITERPPQFIWNKLIDGTYNELQMTFLGSDLSPIKLNDPQMTILLAIKESDETGFK
jgi:hypothetical protein